MFSFSTFLHNLSVSPDMDKAKVLLLASSILPVAVVFFLLRIRRSPSIPIKGRHVFITGGSSGIGLAVAKQAAASGAAKISLLARNLVNLEQARGEILRESRSPLQVAVFSADVRDEAAVKKAVDLAGPIDVLVCNQGVFVPREMEKQDAEEIKFTLDVNLLGNFYLIKAALPGMKDGASRDSPRSIAIISSQAGQVGIYGYTAYSASKFALRGLAEALHHELIGHDIFVSLVFPPDTDTPGLAKEMSIRPEATHAISCASRGMTAVDVAKKILHGIMAKNFMVFCNFEGFMLCLGTAGMSPQRSWLMALAEIFGSGIMRLVAICYQYKWSKTISKCHSKKNIKQPHIV